MKQSGKITIILVLTILLVGFIVFKCYLTCKYDKLMSRIISDNQLTATYQQLPMVYYDTVGYFPESMDDAVAFVQKTYWPDMKEEDLRAQQLLTDPLTKNKEELQYFPLYDYRTKRPVSFLFLSAGIDGKIDNKLSHNDTLYVHNWWADLNVYNYEEAILLENWNKNARECWALSNTPKDVQLPPQPRVHGIRFIDYFCGNKDWIVQLGPI